MTPRAGVSSWAGDHHRDHNQPVPPKWSALLAAILVDMPPLPRASCRGMAPGFDGTRDVDLVLPLTVCRRCPELEHCRAWVESLPPDAVPVGVIAAEVHREFRGRTGRVGGRRKHPAA